VKPLNSLDPLKKAEGTVGAPTCFIEHEVFFF
jgi:hypothetical protein